MTVPHLIKELEQRLSRRYEKDPDDEGYRDVEREGYYHCDYCRTKIYYSRTKPQDLVQHETRCGGSSGAPEGRGITEDEEGEKEL